MTRTLAILVTIAAIAAGAVRTTTGLAVLFALSLVAIGLGRLINTGLTASMPRVVPDRLLAPTNSVLVTVGSALTAVGAVVAFATLAVLGADDAAVCWTLVPAVLTALAGAWAILVLPRGHLGPTGVSSRPVPGGGAVAAEGWRLFADGLAQGCRSAKASSLVWVSLTALTLGRAAFGITTLVAVLLLRDTPGSAGPTVAGMSGFALLTAVVAAGMGLAAVVAPWAIARSSRLWVVASGSALAGAAQLLAGPPLVPALLVAGAFFLGLGNQVVKLVADNAMQTEVPDSGRGGVFALQDALFNSAFVAGAAAVLPWVRADGRSPGVMVAAGGLYVFATAVAVVMWRSTAERDGGRCDGPTR